MPVGGYVHTCPNLFECLPCIASSCGPHTSRVTFLLPLIGVRSSAAAFAISYAVFVSHDANSHPSSIGGTVLRRTQSKAFVALVAFLAFGLTAIAMAWSAYELNSIIDQAFGYGPAQLLLTSENLKSCLNGERADISSS